MGPSSQNTKIGGKSVFRILPGFILLVILIAAVGIFGAFQFQRVIQLNTRVDLADEMIAKLVETTSAFHRLRYATPEPVGGGEGEAPAVLTGAAGDFYDRFRELLSLIEEEERVYWVDLVLEADEMVGSSTVRSRAETIEMLTDRIHAAPDFPDSAGFAAYIGDRLEEARQRALDWGSLLRLDRRIETRKAKGRFIFACVVAVMLGTIVAVFSAWRISRMISP